MKQFEKPFNPKDSASFPDLPEDKKSEYKPIDDASESFVRATAIENPEEAQEDAEKVILAKVRDLRYAAGDFQAAEVRRNEYGEPRGHVMRDPVCGG